MTVLLLVVLNAVAMDSSLNSFYSLFDPRHSLSSESKRFDINSSLVASNVELHDQIITLSGSLFARLISDVKSSFMFNLRNSTFISNNLGFHTRCNQQIALISSDSHLLLHLCSICLEPSMTPTFISNGGSLTLSSIRLDILSNTALVAPLISSPQNGSRALLSGFNFESLSLDLNTPFLLSGPSSTVHLSSSRFRNITTSLLSNTPSRQHCRNTSSSVVVVATTFEHSEMPCQGALTDFDRAESLLVLNSSFLHLRNGDTHNDRITLSSTATYTNDVFIDVSQTDRGSGAAICITTGTLTLERCRFEDLSSGTSGEGGAVFSSGDEVKADRCVFRNCRGRNGGAIFCKTYTKLTVLASQFEKCSSTIEYFLEDYSGDSSNTTHQANGGGGALFIHLKEEHCIVDSLFQDCTAPSFGGGIFIDNADNPQILPDYFRLAFLNETTGSSNSGGHIVFVKVGTIMDYQYDDSTISSFFKAQNTDSSLRVESLVTDSPSRETHNFRIGRISLQNLDKAFLPMNCHVSTTGADSATCGGQLSPCRTVSNAGHYIRTGYTIVIAEGEYKTQDSNVENHVFVASREITFEGQGQREGSAGTKVEFTSPAYNAAIFVTTGTATLSEMTVQLSALSSDEWNLVEVDGGGSVEIDSCALVGTGTEQNGRLVSVVSGSLTVTQSSFSDILSNLDKGAAISASVSSSSSVSISSSSFTSCKLSDGSGVGGAIHLFLEADTADFLLSDLHFTSNEATNAKDVFISAADLSLDKKVLTSAKFAIEWEDNTVDNARFRCESRGGDYGIAEVGIPEYLVQLKMVFVDATQPNDAAGCGKAPNPCQSIRGAANQQTNTELNGHFVVVVGAGLLKGDVTVKSSSFRPNTDTGSAAIQLEAEYSLSCSGSVEFTRMDFTFTQNVVSQTKTLLNLTSGNLVLTECTFKSHTSGTRIKANQLVAVSGTGTIVADELKATDLSFALAVFDINSDSIDIGSVKLSDCEFSGTPTAAFVSLTSKYTSSRLSVGPISFGSSNTDPTPVDPSPLKLAEIKAPRTATIESAATLFTSTSSSFTSNTKISTTDTPAEVVSILKIVSASSFSQTVTNSTINFAAGTDASSAASLVDTSFASLVLADTTVDVSSLSRFFSQTVFAVKAHSLSISFTTLSEVLSDVSGMTCPLVSVSGGTLALSKVKFDGTALPLSFAKSVIVQTGGTVQLADSHFANIASLNRGAAVHSTLTASGHTLTIASCDFTACSATGRGGALTVKVGAGFFVVSTQTTTFSKCSSASNGGAISLDLTGLTSGTFNIAGASFGTGTDANSCGSGKFGKDVFMDGDFTSFNDKTLFPSAYSATPVNEALMESITVSSTHTSLVMPLLQYLHSPTTEGFVDDTIDAADIKQCGHLFVNCKTLSQLKENAPPLSSVKIVSALTIKTDYPVLRTMTITSKEELSRSSLVLVSTPSLSITSSNPTLTLTNLAISTAWSSSARNSDTAYLLIASGKLVVSQSTFTSAASLPCPLVFAKTSGAVEIDDFNATNVLDLKDALIRGQTSATMKVANSNFNSITRTTAKGDTENGTVISAVLKDVSSSTLDTLTFDTCGTAVFLNMEGCPLSLDYSVRNVAFTATTPSQLYVCGDDLSLLLKPSKWTDLPQALADETHEIFMTSSSTWSLVVSLRFYLVPPERLEMFVSSSGRGSDAGDGTRSSPFETIWQSLERAKGQSEDVRVVLVGKGRIGKKSEMVGEEGLEMEIVGESEGSEMECLIVESEGRERKEKEGMITLDRQSLTLSSLLVSLHSSHRSVEAVFILTSSSVLILESCSLRTSEPISHSLICLAGSSSLTVFDLECESVSFVGKGGIAKLSACASLDFSSCSFTSASFGGGCVVWGKTEGTVTVHSTAFTRCSGAAFGSVIRVMGCGTRVKITKCTFSECVTRVRFGEVSWEGGSVGGGCVLVELKSTRHSLSSCDLSLSSFVRCRLENTDTAWSSGTGGGKGMCVGGAGFVVVGGRVGERVELVGVETRAVSGVLSFGLDEQKKRSSPTAETTEGHTLQSILDELSRCGCDVRSFVNTSTWLTVPDLIRSWKEGDDITLLVQLLDAVIDVLKQTCDANIPIVNHQLLHTSLSSLVKNAPLPNNVMLRVTLCFSALKFIEKGPFVKIELEKLDELEQNVMIVPCKNRTC
ncbi:hypothetical protein BLNAU_8242 [Blattamonas nauphoetae]|uniref:Uncharacterized protein n=1 Tax=Blattamonas nauphoetae TaxID=2049346 RepID=A0ABQ9XZ91_9EUKA|nr:hypothetical protein BLNAU_8242 [Blattamonas nauphoetae]